MICEGKTCRYYYENTDMQNKPAPFTCGFYNNKPGKEFDCHKDDFTLADVIYVLEKLISNVHRTPYVGFLSYFKKGKYDI